MQQLYHFQDSTPPLVILRVWHSDYGVRGLIRNNPRKAAQNPLLSRPVRGEPFKFLVKPTGPPNRFCLPQSQALISLTFQAFLSNFSGGGGRVHNSKYGHIQTFWLGLSRVGQKSRSFVLSLSASISCLSMNWSPGPIKLGL